MALAAHDAPSLVAHVAYALSDAVIVATSDPPAKRLLKSLDAWAGKPGFNPSSKRFNAHGEQSRVIRLTAPTHHLSSSIHSLAAESKYASVVVESSDVPGLRPTLANLASARVPGVFVVLVGHDQPPASFKVPSLAVASDDEDEHVPSAHTNGHANGHGHTNGHAGNGHATQLDDHSESDPSSPSTPTVSIPPFHLALPIPSLRPSSLASLHDHLVLAHLASLASRTPFAVLVDPAVWAAYATYVPTLSAAKFAQIMAVENHARERKEGQAALKISAEAGGAYLAVAHDGPAPPTPSASLGHIRAALFPSPASSSAPAWIPLRRPVGPARTALIVHGGAAETALDWAREHNNKGVLVAAVEVGGEAGMEAVKGLAEALRGVEKVVVVEDGFGGVHESLSLALASLTPRPSPFPSVHRARALHVEGASDVDAFVEHTLAGTPPNHLGHAHPVSVPAGSHPAPLHPYLSILHRVHPTTLVLPAPGTPSVFALGASVAHVARWRAAAKAAREAASSKGGEVESVIREWQEGADEAGGAERLKKVEAVLGKHSAQGVVEAVRELGGRAGLERPAWWIVGVEGEDSSDPSTALHTLLASGLPIKLLLLTTTPIDPSALIRPKDIALPALLHGTAYVASTSHSANPVHAHDAVAEAAAFPGPAVVVAYEPKLAKRSEGVKEAKKGVEEGYWPLYRWDPRGDGKWKLEAGKISRQVEKWLGREEQLSLLSKPKPDLPASFASSLEKDLTHAASAASARAYERLMASLSATPLLILYGSDNGAASSVAKRIAAQGRKFKFAPRIAAADEVPIESVVEARKVVYVVSTAGQGEFPANAKETWKAIAKSKKDEFAWGDVEFSVFGMGDSAYWGKGTVESEKYFAKSGKDLHEKLVALGAKPLTQCGLGDDQAADGYLTAFQTWSVDLWTSLGVEGVGPEAEPAVAPDDSIKEASNFLRGSIKESLADETTGAVAELDTKMMKFHGIYQQDDRDIRDSRKHEGLEPAFSFMIRVRLPGGVSTPEQWLAMDKIADERANGTLKITTRQTFQLHGVVKHNLKKAMQGINSALMDTIAACGDVNRNVTCNPNPYQTEFHHEAYEFSKKFSEALLPRTNAYHEIWLDKTLVATTQEEEEPFYGATYLPRKFKCAVAIPPNNDVDIFTNDLGFVGIIEHGKLVGFNLTVGGGMGATHGNKKTYPRLGDVLGYVSKEHAIAAGKEVIAVQRDYGDRTNRKHARLKYTIDDRGLDWFRGEVEKRLGFKLQPAKPFEFTENGDRFGWTSNYDGTHNFCLFIENGRVHDVDGFPMKTALRELAGWHKGDFRLTTNQHLIISRISNAEKPKFEQWLAKYPQFDPKKYSGARLFAAACVALPTCALAFAESERYLPHLVTKLENVLEESGLRNDAIVIRMTGCPNGCARPYNAELAFVGKAPGSYNVLMGGAFNGSRLAKLYKESLGEEEILKELTPIIKRYALERKSGEKFGDFVIRAGYVKRVVVAKTDFHDF